MGFMAAQQVYGWEPTCLPWTLYARGSYTSNNSQTNTWATPVATRTDSVNASAGASPKGIMPKFFGLGDALGGQGGVGAPIPGTNVLNGFVPAQFSGGQGLVGQIYGDNNGTAAGVNDLSTDNGLSGFLLYLIPSTGGNVSGALRDGANRFTISGGNASTAPLVTLSDGSVSVTTQESAATVADAWQILMFRLNAVEADIKTNSRAWKTQTWVAGGSSAGQLARYRASAVSKAFTMSQQSGGLFNGSVMEVGLIDQFLSNITFDNIRKYVNLRYKLAL